MRLYFLKYYLWIVIVENDSYCFIIDVDWRVEPCLRKKVLVSWKATRGRSISWSSTCSAYANNNLPRWRETVIRLDRICFRGKINQRSCNVRAITYRWVEMFHKQLRQNVKICNKSITTIIILPLIFPK